MNLMMLGHSGVGKTTYMASMYGAMQVPINGFTLRAVDPDVHTRLMRSFLYINNGIYPDITDQRTAYEFRLVFEREDFFEFTWIDYRGGALIAPADSNEAAALVEDLVNADGIVMFFDSTRLATKARDRQIGRMTALLTRALEEISVPTPLTLVFTKADEVDALDAAALRPVQNVVDAAAANQLIAGCYVSTACGRQIVNVHVPVLHSLHVGIMSMAMAYSVEIQQYLAQAERQRAQAQTLPGVLHDLIALWRDTETLHDRAKESEQLVQDRVVALIPLIHPAQQLESHLRDYPHF